MLEQWYGIMPNNVLYSKEITDKQKLLFCAISSLCAEKWYCRAKNELLGELLGVDKLTISRNLSKLQEKWFIVIEIINHNERKIWIDKNIKGDWQKRQGGIDENVNPYIYTNITNEYLSEKKSKTRSKSLLTEEQEKQFEEIWNIYPRKRGKDQARKHFLEHDAKEMMFDAKIQNRKVELEIQELQYVLWGGKWMTWFSPQTDKIKQLEVRKIFERHMQIWWPDMRERMERLVQDFPDVDFKKLREELSEKNSLQHKMTFT